MKKATYDKAQETVFRVINGEIMGKKLPGAGQGDPEVDPELCQHPQDKIIRKSNKSVRDGVTKGMDWWLCKACKTRWERFSADSINQSEEPQDSDIYPLGKHAGKTYVEILIACGRL